MLLAGLGAAAHADDVESFYKGRSLPMIIIGFDIGGYDAQFKADADRIKLDVDFVAAAAIDKLLADAYAMPKP
jgi:hypothetical protein